MQTPLITNDAIIFGILLCLLAVVFKTANSEIPFFKKFYAVFPPILLCYFLPGTQPELLTEQPHNYIQ
jgi:hypothetical protein